MPAKPAEPIWGGRWAAVSPNRPTEATRGVSTQPLSVLVPFPAAIVFDGDEEEEYDEEY